MLQLIQCQMIIAIIVGPKVPAQMEGNHMVTAPVIMTRVMIHLTIVLFMDSLVAVLYRKRVKINFS